MRYRNKPVIREAIKWTGNNTEEIKDFCPEIIDRSTYLLITTLEGHHICDKNDYIIKGVKGEFYPCKPDIFEMTYEKVKEAQNDN